MNNETVKEFNIMINLRGDRVYDLYMDGNWVVSRGRSSAIVDDIKSLIEKELMDRKVSK